MSQSGKYSGGGSGSGTVVTLTGNSGGAVGPDGSGNINIVTANSTIIVNGDPGDNTLTMDFSNTNLILGNDASSLAGGSYNVGILGDALASITTCLLYTSDAADE